MTRFVDKEKALALRKQEMSYSQIKNILGVCCLLDRIHLRHVFRTIDPV